MNDLSVLSTENDFKSNVIGRLAGDCHVSLRDDLRGWKGTLVSL